MPTPEQIEAAARAICKTWDYSWDGDPDSDDQVAPDKNEYDERPSKELYRKAAAAALAAAGI